MVRIPDLGSKKNNELMKKVVQHLEQKLPVSAPNGRVFDIQNIRVEDNPARTSSTAQLQMRSLSQDDYYQGKGDLVASVKGDMTITENGKVIDSKEDMIVIKVPLQTERGTYIVDGSEKSIMNMMKARPGVYTDKKSKGDVKTSLMLNPATSAKRTPKINIIINAKTNKFQFGVGRGAGAGKAISGVAFMKALGFTEPEIQAALGTLGNSLMAKFTQKTPLEVFKIVVDKNPKSSSASGIAKELNDYLEGSLSFGESGAEIVKHNIGVDSSAVNRNVLYEAVRKTAKVAAGTERPDDSQSLVYKQIVGDNDFLYEKLTQEIDYMAANAMRTLTKTPRPNAKKKNPEILNIGGVGNLGVRTKSFLKTDAISDTVDQVNPVANAAVGRKITQLGNQTGTLSKNAARGALDNRNLHISQFGRIDPVETPESGKIGFQAHLAQNATIKDGTITTKYLKVTNGVAIDSVANTVELGTVDEKNKVIAFYDTRYLTRSGNKISLAKGQVPARVNGVEQMVASSRVTHIDLAPQNLFGEVSNMIPFVNHNDGNRVLMGANMQKQALDLVEKEVPLVSSAVAPGSKVTYEEKLGKELGKPVYAKTDGIVQEITDEEIIVANKAGNPVAHKYYKYFPLNNGGFINNKLLVAVGSSVRKGQMIAEGWQTKDGKLAIGTNLRIGYMSYDGYNYEDGIVISESTARKMRTSEVKSDEISVPSTCVGGRGSNVIEFLKDGHADVTGLPDYIDSDGLVKEGTVLKPGMIKAIYAEPAVQADDINDFLRVVTKDQWKMKKVMIPTTSYFKGTVQRVTSVQDPGDGDNARIIYTVSSENNLKIGDKLAGRHGNKGTITKILADKEMPVAEDGKKIDILYSPLSIPSRKNVGQLLEANAGLIAEKTGKPFIVNNFDHKDHERVLQGLKEIGLPDGKMSVNIFRDGKAVPVEDRITVGNAYIMKLNHKADEKIQARSNTETVPTFKSNMPAKATGRNAGEKANPQALGNMEVMGLQGHSAVWNLLDSSTIKADGGGDVRRRLTIFNALKGEKDAFKSLEGDAQPETLKVYSDYLQGMGLKITPYNDKKQVTLNDTFSSLGLSFMKPDEILQKIGKENKVGEEITIAISSGRKTKNVDNSTKTTWKDKPGSLKDPKIFGTGKEPEDRKKWGYIELKAPMPNPILTAEKSNPYTLLTDITDKDFRSLMNSSKVLVISPDKSPMYEKIFGKEAAEQRVRAKMIMARHQLTEKSIIPTKKLMEIMDKDDVLIPWKVSGDAVNYMLKNINIDQVMRDTEAKLKSPQKTIGELNKLYKKEKILINLKKDNKKPEDLMMKYVPVLPLHLRPIDDDIDTKAVSTDDLNYIYQKIIRINEQTDFNSFEKDPAMMPEMTPATVGKNMASTWSALSDLMLKSKAKRAHTNAPLKSISDKLQGKEGFLQTEMLSKRQDFSGRGVIGVDPTLALDECKLPYDMARRLFEPMILKEMRDSGISKDDIESNRLLDSKRPEAIQAIKRVIANRPVILNRQPTLHKYGMLAFKPILDLDVAAGEGSFVNIDSPARNIKINPLVVTPFNADFDGDQMAVHVPLTKRSIDEANALLMPSSNIINTNTGRINFPLKGEMVAGLYEMTTAKSRTPDAGVARRYPGTQAGWLQLKNDYLSGKDGMRITTKVDLPPFVGVSVGAALFDFCIPPKYRSKYAGRTATGDLLEKLQTDYVKDAQAAGFKTAGYTQKDVADFYDRIKSLGLDCSTRIGASAISIQDFTKTIDKKIMTQIKKTSLAEVKKEKQEAAKMSGKPFRWSLNQDNRISLENKIQSKIESMIKSPDSYLGQNNALYKMMDSKAKGNADQIRRMTVMVGAGVDVTGKRIAPIEHSNFEGMSPSEYFNHSKDSRKGMYDRSVGTAKPGEMTKLVGRAMQGSQIVVPDCQTIDGIMMAKSSGAIEGRVLAEDVKTRAQGTETVLAKRNTIITPELAAKIAKDETVPLTIKIRSPLRCKAHNGICQMCYGAKPGTRTLVPMGDPIGINATHALGEPITQMTMKTFHQGGTSTQVTQGMPALTNILSLNIDPTKSKKSVKFSSQRNLKSAPKDPIAERRMVQDKMVSGLATAVGGSLQKMENLGDQYKGVNLPIVSTPALDSRHLETIVGKLTSQGKIIDPGDSKFMNGSVREANELDQWNAANPTLRPIRYINNYQSYMTSYNSGNQNWLQHTAAQDARRNLANAAAQGFIDQIDTPTTRFMTGKLQRVGEGWDIFNKAKNYANGISTNMRNIFSPTPNSVRKSVEGKTSTPFGFMGDLFGKKKKKK